MRELPPPIQQFNTTLPGGVTAVLNRALAKRPEDRFTSTAEFVRSLTQALASATVVATAHVLPACVLTVVQGPQSGTVHTVARDAPFVFGREAGANLVVNDSRVSRRHFRIIVEAGDYWIEDLGSANGSYVNGVRSERTQLTSGDVIKAGNVEFEVSLEVAPSAVLTIRDESGASRTCELRGSVTCGRDATNDIVLIDDLISRHHVRLLPEKGGYRVEDLQSSNGTFVNGRRVQSALLQSGDVILIGNFGLEYRQAEARG